MLSVDSNYDVVLDSKNKNIVELGSVLTSISNQNLELAIIAVSICISDAVMKLTPQLDANNLLKDFFYILSRTTALDVKQINRQVISIINNKQKSDPNCLLADNIRESNSFLEVLLKKEYVLSNLDYELMNANYKSFKYITEVTHKAIRSYPLENSSPAPVTEEVK